MTKWYHEVMKLVNRLYHDLKVVEFIMQLHHGSLEGSEAHAKA